MQRGDELVVGPNLSRIANVDHKSVFDWRNKDPLLLLAVENLQRGHVVILKLHS